MRVPIRLLALFLCSAAVPSSSFAQVLDIPVPARNAVKRLDRIVPVAAVTRDGDPIALGNAQPGDGFVLGDAKFDLTDPTYPKIAFTITNAAATPLSLGDVAVHEVRVTSISQRPPKFICRAVVFSVGRWANGAVLQPGARVTVEVGAVPECAPAAAPAQETVGFLVSIRGDGVQYQPGEENALLAKAFEQLRSHSAN